jgi:hypothetical protein
MKSRKASKIKSWPNKHPLIYEINTWVWLQELGQAQGRPVTLADVPGTEWDALAALRPDAVWFMGVWERSPAGMAVSMNNAGLLADFQRALPDFAAADNVGSPYCVRRYVVDEQLGGPAGLAAAPAAACPTGHTADPRLRPQSRGPGPPLGGGAA